MFRLLFVFEKFPAFLFYNNVVTFLCFDLVPFRERKQWLFFWGRLSNWFIRCYLRQHFDWLKSCCIRFWVWSFNSIWKYLRYFKLIKTQQKGSYLFQSWLCNSLQSNAIGFHFTFHIVQRIAMVTIIWWIKLSSDENHHLPRLIITGFCIWFVFYFRGAAFGCYVISESAKQILLLLAQQIVVLLFNVSTRDPFDDITRVRTFSIIILSLSLAVSHSAICSTWAQGSAAL